MLLCNVNGAASFIVIRLSGGQQKCEVFYYVIFPGSLINVFTVLCWFIFFIIRVCVVALFALTAQKVENQIKNQFYFGTDLMWC